MTALPMLADASRGSLLISGFCTSQGARRIGFREFMAALPLMAEDRGISVEEVTCGSRELLLERCSKFPPRLHIPPRGRGTAHRHQRGAALGTTIIEFVLMVCARPQPP